MATVRVAHAEPLPGKLPNEDVLTAGPAEFEHWFERLFTLLPGLRLSLTGLVVTGWPWNTTVVARLSAAATLADGTSYTNEAVQWIQLRWGRMTDDYVLEDTARLAAALRRQTAARPGR